MPSWRSLPQTDMVSACAGDTARFATTCSPSSTILKWPPTTTEANESCVPPRHIARSPAASALTGAPTSLPQSAPSSEPPPAEASMPIRPSDRPYAGNPSSNRVEQLQDNRRVRSSSAKANEAPAGAFRRVGVRVLYEFSQALPLTIFFFVGFNLIVLTTNLLVA